MIPAHKRWTSPPHPQLDAVQIRSACEASLRRLQTSYLDLYQVSGLLAGGWVQWCATGHRISSGYLVNAILCCIPGCLIINCTEVCEIQAWAFRHLAPSHSLMHHLHMYNSLFLFSAAAGAPWNPTLFYFRVWYTFMSLPTLRSTGLRDTSLSGARGSTILPRNVPMSPA